MADWLPKKTRSRIMANIRSKKTKPEIALKKALQGFGFSYQPKMIGSPDFANKKKKIAIFVHGCFWHKCPKHYKQPESNKKYWLPKLQKNVERDKRNEKMLKSKGYKVIKIWEHDIPKNMNKIIRRIK